MTDIYLDKTNHDIVVRDNDLILVSGLEQVEQALRIRLWFFRSEWFLDTSKGLLDYENILVKSPNLGEVESLIKATILGTPDVLDLLEFDMTFDRSARSLGVTFTVNTIYGVVTL